MNKGASAATQQDVQEAKKRLQQFIKTLDRVPTEILQEEQQTLYSEIIEEVPYATGKLERSVHVSVSRSKTRPGINASASARSKRGYNYAGIQHENDSFNHPIKGKAHYIRDPFNRMIERFKQKCTENIKF